MRWMNSSEEVSIGLDRWYIDDHVEPQIYNSVPTCSSYHVRAPRDVTMATGAC